MTALYVPPTEESDHKKQNQSIQLIGGITTTNTTNIATNTASIAALSVSSGITFTQSGTGAVTRTVQSKLRDVVNAADFGVVGDGVTNNTTAWANAIAALPATGGTLIMPTGVCIGTVVANKPMILQGHGKGSTGATGDAATELRSTGAADNVLLISSPGVIAKDFSVTSSIAAGSRTGAGVKITSGPNVLLDGVFSRGHKYGFWNQSPGNEFQYCLATFNLLHGFFLDGSVTTQNETGLYYCQANGNTSAGFHTVAGGSGQTAGVFFVRPTAASNTGNGMTFSTGVNDIYIQMPEMSTNGGINIDLSNNGTSASCAIIGGLIEASTLQAIFIGQNCCGVTISGNTITCGGQSGIVNDGIETTITGNVFGGAFTAGGSIQLGAHSTFCVITGNSLSTTLGGATPVRGMLIDAGAAKFSLAGGNFSAATTAVSGAVPAGSRISACIGVADV